MITNKDIRIAKITGRKLIIYFNFNITEQNLHLIIKFIKNKYNVKRYMCYKDNFVIFSLRNTDIYQIHKI